MRVSIHGISYTFSENVLAQQDTRNSYFALANAMFSLNFDIWYQSGYWDHRFIPYVLYDGDVAVSSVGVCLNDVIWQNQRRRYAQISTVMTLPEYRGRGLSRWLMEYALAAWKDQCDGVYLLANDSVAEFYPRFGFEEFAEYDFTMPIQKTRGEYRKLNLADGEDLRLLVKKYEASNPFAALRVDNLSQFMFHCLHFHASNIYYLKTHDTVAIVENNGKQMICYELLAGFSGPLEEILGVLATEETESALLGFTPQAVENCAIVESQEEDNHLFVLAGKENIFKAQQVVFPLLSRA